VSEASSDRSFARHVIVHGRVQGIGYRAWTQIAALEFGLTGWVRNRRDGSVEAVFIGAERDVLDMIEACRRGPPGARVDVLHQRAALAEDVSRRRGDELFSVLATA
jgi:acylphosphatase